MKVPLKTPHVIPPGAEAASADGPGMYCRKCGYNLLNLPERRCPECGQAFNPHDVTTFALYSHPRFVRIWMHLPLVGVASVIGFFGGGLVGERLAFMPIAALPAAIQSIGWVPMLIGAPLFFGGAILGLRMVPGLITRLLPVNCSRCNGRAYYVLSGKQIAYRCASCGYEQPTPVHTN